MTPASPALTATDNVRAFARDIKLSHTLFALPFALSAAWMVASTTDVPWHAWIWIVVAMVGARSSAKVS